MNRLVCLTLLACMAAAAPVVAAPAAVSLPIKLVYPGAGSPRGLLPVSTTVFFEGDLPEPPARARWVLEHEPAAGRWEALPAQVDRWQRTGGGAEKRPGWTAELTFFPPEGNTKRVPLRLRLVAAGESMPRVTSPAPDFRLARGARQWTIENPGVQFKLDGTDQAGSGQLAAVTVTTKRGPAEMATQRGPAIHRNPDIYIHGRPWAHAHKWNPPDETSVREGPVVVEIVRTGTFPGMPAARLAVRYRFFAGRSLVESTTEVELLQDVSLISLRNDQLIFTPGTFTHFGWRDRRGVEARRFADFRAINDHGDILKLQPDTPWIMFWDPAKGIAAGTVRISEFQAGPRFSSPVRFDHTTLIMNREELQSWVRPQVYQNVSWSREAGMHLPAGSRFSEVVLYCFSGETAEPERSLVERVYQESQSLPLIEVGAGPFPPVP